MTIDNKKFPEAVLRDGTRVVLPCRIAYVHLENPWTSDAAKNEPKYSVCCIISKEDKETIKTLRKAEANALEAGIQSKWGGKKPYEPKSVIHDGERRSGEPGFDNCIYFSPSSNQSRQPSTLNRLKEKIDPAQIYSGCYALVSVNFYPYDVAGGKGVGAGLNAVLKMYDGERMGGGGDGSRDFDEIEIEEDFNLDNM